MKDKKFEENKTKHDRYLDFNGVRITPKVMVFRNAFEGKIFNEKILFQNISRNPVTLRTCPPNVPVFQVERYLRGISLCSGLSAFCKLKYVGQNRLLNPVSEGSMAIYVNDQVYHYQIIVQVSTGIIAAIPRMVNFGVVNAGHTVNVRTIELRNKGYKTTKFEIDLASNDMDLVIRPVKGFIQARSSMNVSVEFIGFYEGNYYKEIWVKCDIPFRISVSATVIIPKLYSVDLNSTENFTFIKFASIYGACKSYNTCSFVNYNTLNALYIVVPEINSEILSFQSAVRINPMYNCFEINPVDGCLKPDEEKRLSICFQPGEHDFVQRKDYFLFFRIIRLHSMGIEKDEKRKLKTPIHNLRSRDIDSVESKTSFNEDESEITSDHCSKYNMQYIEKAYNGSEYIRLCLHAIVEPCRIDVYPDEKNLGDILINSTHEFPLKIYNKNKNLPIFFEYHKSAFVEVEPKKGYLKSKEIVKLNVVVSPKSTKNYKIYVHINILYPNQPASSNTKKLQTVGKIIVPVTVNVLLPTKKPKTKFNMGITPIITHEVGFKTEEVRFSDKIEKPRAAMLDCKRDDNALIAFPNDRPNTLRPLMTIDSIKTIFAGIPRILPERDEYMLTDKQLLLRTATLSYFSSYFKYYRDGRPETKDTGCDIETDRCDALESKLLKTSFEEKQLKESGDQIIESDHKGYDSLTPIQMFFVKIKPSSLEIGKVAHLSTGKYKLRFENQNDFPIKIYIKSLHSTMAMLPNLPQDHIIGVFGVLTVEIEFYAALLGRFNTIINAVLNNCHFIPILFKVNVVPQSLSFDKSELVIDAKEANLSTQLQVINNLNVSVKFLWEMPKGGCFSVKPTQGTVPSNRFLTCELYYSPDFSSRISSRLNLVCENGLAQSICITMSFENIDIGITDSVVHFSNLPLNIATTRTTILRNYGYQTVLFTIRNPSPFPGINISPSDGIIQKRCDQIITITILIAAMIEFECTVDVEFHQREELSFQITGKTEFPRVVMKPEVLHLKRIAAGSFDMCPFSLENTGQTLVHISYLKDMYPETMITTVMDVANYKDHINDLTLKPGEKVNLYLKYVPFDVSMSQFCLPLVINGIFGPPVYETPDSLNPEVYLRRYENLYITECSAKILQAPKVLPCIVVESIAVRHLIKLSKNYIKFKYLPYSDYRSTVKSEIKISNACKEVTTFCIRIDELKPYFKLEPTTTENVTITDLAIIVDLQPEADLHLKVEFVPSITGLHVCYLPIFIRKYGEGSVFNYITLKGLYPNGILRCIPELHLEPVPLCEKAEDTVIIDAQFHTKGCHIHVRSSVNALQFVFIRGTKIPADKIKSNIEMKVKFVSEDPMSFNTYVKITCDCGGSCGLFITGCTDKSRITTHTYNHITQDKEKMIAYSKAYVLYQASTCENLTLDKFQSKNLDKYPFFPADCDNTEYAKYMRNICNIMEKWLFEQVFFGNFYCTIPQSMTEIYHDFKKKKDKYPDKQMEQPDRLVIVQILVNLMDTDIIPILVSRPIPEDELDRVSHFHSTYRHVLDFLEVQGATLPHVSPEYLLKYQDYITYETRIVSPKPGKPVLTLDKYKFFLRSKQCWLDIVMQIFKVLVLERLTKINTAGLNLAKSVSTLSAVFRSKIGIVNTESILLAWLTEHFNLSTDVLAELDTQKYGNEFSLKTREVTNFDNDLSDGLVLITVVLSYCPYLAQYLKGIYVKIDSKEKSFHNASRLISALRMIQCSFSLTPSQIIKPLAVQMLLFTTYLYEVFPSLTPKATLEFKVSLSGTTEHEIMIKNPNKYPLNYNIIYLNNDLNCFSTTYGKVLKVLPMKNIKVKIVYIAKKIARTNCTLIFWGDTNAGSYSKSLVFNLIGEPTFEKEHFILCITIPIYSTTQKSIQLQSPYKDAAQYDIWFCYSEPTNLNNLRLFSWKDVQTSKKPRLIHSNSTKLDCDQQGKGILTVVLACCSMIMQELWVFFSNRELGDFMAKIEICAGLTKSQEKEIIEIFVPPKFNSVECACKSNHLKNPLKCPRIVKVKIPCKNYRMWTTVCEMFLLTVPSHEKEIWKRHLEGDAGPHILKWLLGDHFRDSAKAILHIFRGGIKYFITASNRSVTMPTSISVEDVRSPGQVSIIMHINDEIKYPIVPFDVTLRSEDDIEIRLYKVVFKEKMMITDSKWKF